MMTHYDLAILGGGSGGIGAAIAASRLGLSVLLVEKADTLGGTAVRGGVHVWEPTAGSTGLPFDIYRQLKRIPNAVGIYSYGRHAAWGANFPGGEQVIDPTQRYINTLRKHGQRKFGENESICREQFHGVVFEPDAYVQTVATMLRETGRCSVLLQTGFRSVQTGDGWVKSITLDDGRHISAETFIDATGDGLVCQACGSDTMFGRDAKSAFGESHAPESPSRDLNAVTLIYRITPTGAPGIEPLPSDVPDRCWWRNQFPCVSATQYPNGDFNMNMLPTMEGSEFFQIGYESAYAECRRRILSHWHYLQTEYPEFQRFRIAWIAPALGVRESRRIVGEYVLSENDILAGPNRQLNDIIALTDHSIDRHGDSGGYFGLDQPYGVPYRCLIPRGFENLFVACRAASFSSLAASSCRLSRTMMQLGQAAGTAAYVARQNSVPVAEIPIRVLQDHLRAQHVQLDHPMPAELLNHIQNEEDHG